MKSRTVVEEDVAMMSPYRPIKALAERRVLDDGSIEISSHVGMLGITFTLDEVAFLIRELPRVVERSGALAARLKIESYEPPKLTPVGNLNDRLAEVCADHGPAPAEPSKLEIVAEAEDASSVVVIVNGQDVVVEAKSTDDLASVKKVALERTGNSGRPLEHWVFRNEIGMLLSDGTLVKDLGWKPRVFLTPDAGIGGNVLVAPVSLTQPRKED